MAKEITLKEQIAYVRDMAKESKDSVQEFYENGRKQMAELAQENYKMYSTIRKTLINAEHRELQAAIILHHAHMGMKISIRKIGYDQYEIEMETKSGRTETQVLPENHLFKIDEVLKFLNNKLSNNNG